MSHPRGGRRPKQPRDPRVVLRALRACRDAMVAVSAEVEIGAPIYKAAGMLLAAIDGMAAALTGDRYYFTRDCEMNPTSQADYARKLAIERGELPWPKERSFDG